MSTKSTTSPPLGVLVLLKRAKGRLKDKMNTLLRAADREVANMERIQAHQQKIVGLVGVSLITLGNVLANWINVNYVN